MSNHTKELMDFIYGPDVPEKVKPPRDGKNPRNLERMRLKNAERYRKVMAKIEVAKTRIRTCGPEKELGIGIDCLSNYV